MNIPKYINPSTIKNPPKISQFYKSPIGGSLNRPDYTQWNKNIKEGNPEKNLMPSYKKGGVVNKTGLALVHKGELIIPVDQVDSYHALKGNIPFKSPQSKWRYDMTGGRML